MAHHALHVLGSRILGFTQDPFNDTADVRPDPDVAARRARELAAIFPHVGELARRVPPTKARWAAATTTSSSRSGST